LSANANDETVNLKSEFDKEAEDAIDRQVNLLKDELTKTTSPTSLTKTNTTSIKNSSPNLPAHLTASRTLPPLPPISSISSSSSSSSAKTKKEKRGRGKKRGEEKEEGTREEEEGKREDGGEGLEGEEWKTQRIGDDRTASLDKADKKETSFSRSPTDMPRTLSWISDMW